MFVIHHGNILEFKESCSRRRGGFGLEVGVNVVGSGMTLGIGKIYALLCQRAGFAEICYSIVLATECVLISRAERSTRREQVGKCGQDRLREV